MDQTFEQRVKDSFDVMMSQQRFERTILPINELHRVQEFLNKGWDIEVQNASNVLLKRAAEAILRGSSKGDVH